MPEFGEFYAYLLSGGTFELLLVKRSAARYDTAVVGGTLDVTAGQIIDRTGVMLGLSFPCGTELEKLASANSRKVTDIKTSVKDTFCNLSGLQNKAEELYRSGRPTEYVAAYVLQTVITTLDSMTGNALKKRELPILFSGGVASNGIIKEYFKHKYGAYFAKSAFSSDNAAGTALLAYERYINEK
jgi:N6-L-threonylcarbamoyladenine synthase